ncbi:7704_t:CDS:2 [Entrophospora sp. SA101]|nr:7704_t:CDS:2 [Entrophospora sp. SA101]
MSRRDYKRSALKHGQFHFLVLKEGIIWQGMGKSVTSYEILVTQLWAHHRLQKVPYNLPYISGPPVIIIIHGGAWRSGDKSELESFCEKLTKINKKTIVKLETSLKGTHMGIMYTNQLVDKIWEFIISIESN